MEIPAGLSPGASWDAMLRAAAAEMQRRDALRPLLVPQNARQELFMEALHDAAGPGVGLVRTPGMPGPGAPLQRDRRARAPNPFVDVVPEPVTFDPAVARHRLQPQVTLATPTLPGSRLADDEWRQQSMERFAMAPDLLNDGAERGVDPHVPRGVGVMRDRHGIDRKAQRSWNPLPFMQYQGEVRDRMARESGPLAPPTLCEAMGTAGATEHGITSRANEGLSRALPVAPVREDAAVTLARKQVRTRTQGIADATVAAGGPDVAAEVHGRHAPPTRAPRAAERPAAVVAPSTGAAVDRGAMPPPAPRRPPTAHGGGGALLAAAYVGAGTLSAAPMRARATADATPLLASRTATAVGAPLAAPPPRGRPWEGGAATAAAPGVALPGSSAWAGAPPRAENAAAALVAGARLLAPAGHQSAEPRPGARERGAFGAVVAAPDATAPHPGGTGGAAGRKTSPDALLSAMVSGIKRAFGPRPAGGGLSERPGREGAGAAAIAAPLVRAFPNFPQATPARAPPDRGACALAGAPQAPAPLEPAAAAGARQRRGAPATGAVAAAVYADAPARASAPAAARAEPERGALVAAARFPQAPSRPAPFAERPAAAVPARAEVAARDVAAVGTDRGAAPQVRGCRAAPREGGEVAARTAVPVPQQAPPQQQQQKHDPASGAAWLAAPRVAAAAELTAYARPSVARSPRTERDDVAVVAAPTGRAVPLESEVERGPSAFGRPAPEPAGGRAHQAAHPACGTQLGSVRGGALEAMLGMRHGVPPPGLIDDDDVVSMLSGVSGVR